MSRQPWQGTRQILQFNWPFYAVALPLLGLGTTALRSRKWPRLLEAGGRTGLALGAFWLASSVLASWWVYDASPLMRWQWLSELLPEKPVRWANFHAGLDESTPTLRRLFGENGHAFDFFDTDTMTEPSIRRARALYSPEIAPQNVDFRALPLPGNTLDAAFVFFAAHELRSHDNRAKFFSELHHVLAPGGRLVVLEHVRDAANFAAFGPGAFHFWPANEWQRLARNNFETETATRITPFVRLWVWRKMP